MPLSSERKPSTRQKIDPRDTYRYTTPDISPQARPTDNYVKPPEPKKMTALSELMGALNTFGDVYERQQYQKEKEAVAQGETDYNTGQAPPPGSHEARIRKYDELRGRGKSFEFFNEATDLYMKNQSDDPATLAGKMQGLVQKYQTEYGRGSPDFMNGFAPRAREILHSIDAMHANKRRKDYEDEVLANGRSIISGELERGGLDNPQGIRDSITQLQLDAKALGLTRTQVAEMAFDFLHGRAIVTGDTRYIAPLTIRDASGVSIADVVGPDKVGALLNRTESVQHSRWTMEKQMAKEAENEKQSQIQLGILREFYQLDKNDIDGHVKLQQKILSYATASGNPDGIALDPNVFNHLNVLIEGRKGKGGWAEESDPEVLVDILRKAKLGQLSEAELIGKRSKLSYQDAKTAIGYKLTHEDKLQDQASREGDARWKEGQKRAVKLTVGEKNPFLGKFMTQNESELEENVIRWYQEFQEMWLAGASNGQQPTPKDIEGALEYIKIRKDKSKWKDHTPQLQPAGQYTPQGNSPAGKAGNRFENLRKNQQQGQQNSKLSTGELRSMVETEKTNLGFDHIPTELLLAMVGQESGGQTGVVSPKGAGGLMQLMPDTARGEGVTNVFDPRENIRGGISYFAKQLARFKDIGLALAAYNAGPEAVAKHGNKIPPYAETQKYVSNILANYGRIMAQRLYSTG